MENEGIEVFVKYNYFHKEQKRGYKKDAFLNANLFYNKEEDFHVCPMGQHMDCIGHLNGKTELGF
jgi:hypothetical protein